MKLLLTSLVFILICFASKAQNCGDINSFTAEVIDNGNGTSNYTFTAHVISTSGGDKSLNINSITCGAYTFAPVGTDPGPCINSFTIGQDYTFGPYLNVTTCVSTPVVNYTGRSNAGCGGANCTPKNVSAVVLPVELSSLRAAKNDNKVVIDWATESELNNEKFIIERSEDGRIFKSIGEVAGNGTSYEQKEYHFIDENPLQGFNHYRLKQVDFDGGHAYSKIVIVDFEQKGNGIKVFPNPFNGYLHLVPLGSSGDFSDGFMEISLRSTSGKLMKKVEANAENNTIDLQDIPSGIYLLEIRLGGKKFIQKLIKE